MRREVKARDEIKYALSNAPSATPVHRLAQMQGQRYWIERSFQDGKSQAGLDHYQVRGWTAWHHHMALVMMAMLFMLQECCMPRYSARPFPDSFAPGKTVFAGLFGINLRTTARAGARSRLRRYRRSR